MVAQTGPYLTSRQLADRLDVTAETVRQWRGRGAGPAWYKVGGRYRYDVASVDRWLASHAGGGEKHVQL